MIMTPADPRWREFANRLAGPEGCDFKEPGTWQCQPGFAFARAILTDMGYEVAASLEYFAARGGGCDCEILFNLDAEGA